MKKLILRALPLWLCLAGFVCSCGGEGTGDSASSAPPIDTLQVLAQHVEHVARLYTTEYRIHKIVTQSDEPRLQGSIFGQSVDWKLPASERRIAVPIDVMVKAYIDFAGFSAQQVRREGEGLVLTLPDPVIVVTAAKIDNAELRQYADLFGSRYTDAEMLALARQGEDSVRAHIDRADILRTARQSGAQTLLPLLRRMGFEEDKVSVEFRSDLRPADVKLTLKE